MRTRQQKNGKTSRRAHLTVLVHRELAIMLGRDIKLYTTVEPPAVDPSVAPPKIFAKYALSQKSADVPLNSTRVYRRSVTIGAI